MHAEHVEGIVIAEYAASHTRTKKKQTTPATRPSTIDPIGPAKPEAGVTATRPATAPEIMPSSEGLPLSIHSANIQPSVAAAVATKVLTKASAVVPFASRFDPALKPNQPTQRSEAPIIDMVTRMRRLDLARIADPLAEQQAADEAGDAGVDMDDGAAGEIERAQFEQEAGIGEDRVESGLRGRLGGLVVGVGKGLGGVADRVGTRPVPDAMRDRESR